MPLPAYHCYFPVYPLLPPLLLPCRTFPFRFPLRLGRLTRWGFPVIRTLCAVGTCCGWRWAFNFSYCRIERTRNAREPACLTKRTLLRSARPRCRRLACRRVVTPLRNVLPPAQRYRVHGLLIACPLPARLPFTCAAEDLPFTLLGRAQKKSSG